MQIARTVCLVVALAGCGKKDDPPTQPPSADPAKHNAAAEADRAAGAAADQAQQLKIRLDALNAELAVLDAEVTKAVDAAGTVTSDADRAATKAKIDELRKRQADLQARIAAAKASAK